MNRRTMIVPQLVARVDPDARPISRREQARALARYLLQCVRATTPPPAGSTGSPVESAAESQPVVKEVT
jgi:hypothetical protein